MPSCSTTYRRPRPQADCALPRAGTQADPGEQPGGPHCQSQLTIEQEAKGTSVPRWCEPGPMIMGRSSGHGTEWSLQGDVKVVWEAWRATQEGGPRREGCRLGRLLGLQHTGGLQGGA